MNLSPQSPFLMIGCGHMGRALVDGWCASAIDPKTLIIIDRHPDRLTSLGVAVHASLDELPDNISPAVMCLAVKPTGLDDLLPKLASRFADASPLILSVIAGKSLSYYESSLTKKIPIIRLMPNTPSPFQMGMTGCVANDSVAPEQRDWTDQLMKAIGETLWLESEEQMHAITAISGSGPAFVYYLMECFIDAAKEQGFDDAQARQLATQTFVGSSAMAKHSSESISQLRDAVTSKGGTTEAGLHQLMQGDVMERIRQTIKATKARSLELS